MKSRTPTFRGSLVECFFWRVIDEILYSKYQWPLKDEVFGPEIPTSVMLLKKKKKKSSSWFLLRVQQSEIMILLPLKPIFLIYPHISEVIHQKHLVFFLFFFFNSVAGHSGLLLTSETGRKKQDLKIRWRIWVLGNV